MSAKIFGLQKCLPRFGCFNTNTVKCLKENILNDPGCKVRSQDLEKAKTYTVFSGCKHLDKLPCPGFRISLPKPVFLLFHKICFTL